VPARSRLERTHGAGLKCPRGAADPPTAGEGFVAGRGAERTKQRAACTLTLDGRRHNGFVLDLSQSGLFIQTSATPAPGQRLDIELVIRGETLAMHVEVVRRKAVPAQLLTVAHGGIGVRILAAPELFYQLLTTTRGPSTGGTRRAPGVERAAGSPPPARPAQPRRGPAPARAPVAPRVPAVRFRVRVSARHGARSRTLQVEAADEAAARREVSEELGDDWKILEISRA
jgi:hypothetical protein